MTDQVSLLADHWNIEATAITPLGGEIDASALVDSTDGRTYCLKARRHDGSDDTVALEIAALEHLGGSITPLVRPTADGQSSVHVDGSTYWLLDWAEGDLWSELTFRPASLHRALGTTARRLQRGLADFEHAAAHRTHHWDLRTLDRSIELHLDQCADDNQRAIAAKALNLFEQHVAPRLDRLPQAVVHQDLNDFNLIVRISTATPELTVIDFGDMLHSAAITELAVAMAYAMLRTPHPLDAAAEVAAGWFDDAPPTDDELSVLFPLAFGRLAVNALTWSARRDAQPDYAHARSSHTWSTLTQLAELSPAFIEARIAAACGADLPTATPPQSVDTNLGALPVLDLDPHRDAFDDVDPTDTGAVWSAVTPSTPFALAHDRVRLDLTDPADGAGGPATIQLGVELHLSGGTEVSVPMAGTVVEASAERVVVEHTVVEDTAVEALWSCWTGLDAAVARGVDIDAGAVLGVTRPDTATNVQLLRFQPTAGEVVPTRVRPADRAAWANVSIDPAPLLGLDPDTGPARASEHSVTALRNARLAASQRYYYDEPMTLVRASGVTFVDEHAHQYLDVINNVTHVGHGNPHVVETAARQMRRLNTNSRFVYEQMGAYADRLASLLPDPLNVVFLVCTGSEANDLAIRISRQVTGRTDVMVVDGAYHGNTGVVTGISPNRYKGPGGQGPPPTTHEVVQPDRYRGAYGYDDPDPGEHYADDVRQVVAELTEDGTPPAAFIAESLMGTAGQIVYPEGYLARAFDHVRAAGGLCISDEVQVGFGRLGHTFWGFQRGGVVPDIVTMGKPMGNGHPIAAVVTTHEIADRFDQGMKYFNTFGGNPVSCAVAGAVLDEIENHGLQARALDVGGYFMDQLRTLLDIDERVGDVRGEGLYLGVEFVLDRTTKAPATALTSAVCERLRQRGIIMYPNGPRGNSLKIKPPMVFDRGDVDRFVTELRSTLAELS